MHMVVPTIINCVLLLLLLLSANAIESNCVELEQAIVCVLFERKGKKEESKLMTRVLVDLFHLIYFAAFVVPSLY